MLTSDGRVLDVAAGTGALTHDPAYRIDCADRNRSTLKPHIARTSVTPAAASTQKQTGSPGRVARQLQLSIHLNRSTDVRRPAAQ